MSNETKVKYWQGFLTRSKMYKTLDYLNLLMRVPSTEDNYDLVMFKIPKKNPMGVTDAKLIEEIELLIQDKNK